MRLLAFVPALLVAAVLSAQSAYAAPEADLDAAFMTAVYAADGGDFDSAVIILEEIKDKANDPYIYQKLSDYYINLKMYDTAQLRLKEGLSLFEDSAELNYSLAQLYLFYYRDAGIAEIYAADALKISRDVKYLFLMADLYKLLGDGENLLEILNELAVKEPSAKVFTERGDVYRRMGQFDKAEADYLKAFEFDEDLSAAARLSELYMEQGDFDKAVKFLTVLSEKRPDFTLSDMRLAEIFRLMEDSDKALEAFKRVLPRLNGPERVYVLRQIAGIYYAADDYENAIEYFMQITELAPTDVQAHYSLGIINEINGNYKEAEMHYRRALALRADYVEVRKRLGYIALRDKKYGEGIEVVSLIPEELRDIDYYRITGALYKEQGNLDKAYEVLSEGYEENPSAVEIVIDFALVMEQQKKYDECFDLLKAALEYNPNDPSLMNFLGYTYADLNINLDEAYALIEAALAQDPENPAYLDSMAWVLYRFEKYEEAYGYQLRAIRKAPAEQEIADHMKAIMQRLEMDKSIEDVIKGK